MTNDSTTKPIHPASLSKRMLQGAGIALIIISAFLLSGGEGDPSWPKLWMLRPLIIVPLAGAFGGFFVYQMDYLRSKGGWKTTLAYILCFIVCFVTLWFGSILGLVGTYWH